MVERDSHKVVAVGSNPTVITRVAHPTTPVERLCRSEAPLVAEMTGETTGHHVCVAERSKAAVCKTDGITSYVGSNPTACTCYQTDLVYLASWYVRCAAIRQRVIMVRVMD